MRWHISWDFCQASTKQANIARPNFVHNPASVDLQNVLKFEVLLVLQLSQELGALFLLLLAGAVVVDKEVKSLEQLCISIRFIC